MNWCDEAGQEVAKILEMVYVSARDKFEAAAARRGISLEQLALAAVTEMLRQRIQAAQ